MHTTSTRTNGYYYKEYTEVAIYLLSSHRNGTIAEKGYLPIAVGILIADPIFWDQKLFFGTVHCIVCEAIVLLAPSHALVCWTTPPPGKSFSEIERML